LVGLRRIAPVTAIRGNVDIGIWARHYSSRRPLRLNLPITLATLDMDESGDLRPTIYQLDR